MPPDARFETPPEAEEAEGHGGVRRQATHALKWSSAAQLLSRAGAFTIGLILARLLVPEEYGTYVVALGVVTILLTVDDMGLRQGLVRLTSEDEAPSRTALTLATISGLVAYAVGFLIAPVVASVTSTPNSTSMIRVLCLALIIDTLLHVVPSAALQRRFRQDLLTLSELAGLVVDFSVTILLAATNHGAWSLVWGSLAGQVARSVASQLLARVRPRFGFDRQIARELIRVSGPFALASFVGAALLNVDYLLVGNILGPAAVGLYLIAFNVSSWPTSLVGAAVRGVAVPGFAQLTDRGGDVAATFSKALVLLAAAGIPFVTLLAVAPESVITGLYGDQWGAGAGALRFLAVLALVRLLGGLADDVLFALGRSSWILAKNTIWMVALAPAIVVGAHADGLRGVGIAQAAVALVVVVPTLVVMIARLRLWHPSALLIVKMAPGAVLAGVCGWMVDNNLDGSAFARAAASGVVILGVFALTLLPFRQQLRF
ncbi:MAG TPA: oligosaccharide flippase family protein [Ilumatobacteraceae bacterium]|nr:oligosaccharide flippase family protein [Ilumatobacteraceae bacterium]